PHPMLSCMVPTVCLSTARIGADSANNAAERETASPPRRVDVISGVGRRLAHRQTAVNICGYHMSKLVRNVPVLDSLEISPPHHDDDAGGRCGKLFCSFPRSGGRVLFASTAPAASTGRSRVPAVPDAPVLRHLSIGQVMVDRLLAPGMIRTLPAAPPRHGGR